MSTLRTKTGDRIRICLRRNGLPALSKTIYVVAFTFRGGVYAAPDRRCLWPPRRKAHGFRWYRSWVLEPPPLFNFVVTKRVGYYGRGEK